MKIFTYPGKYIKIMAQMNRRTNINTDKELSVIIDEDKVHFFNYVTGEILS